MKTFDVYYKSIKAETKDRGVTHIAAATTIIGRVASIQHTIHFQSKHQSTKPHLCIEAETVNQNSWKPAIVALLAQKMPEESRPRNIVFSPIKKLFLLGYDKEQCFHDTIEHRFHLQQWNFCPLDSADVTAKSLGPNGKTLLVVKRFVQLFLVVSEKHSDCSWRTTSILFELWDRPVYLYEPVIL